MWIVLFVGSAIQEASIPFMWVFGIVMMLSLLVLCNSSRRWGTIGGIVAYGLLELLQERSLDGLWGKSSKEKQRHLHLHSEAK